MSFVTVPVEPTEAMIEAYSQALRRHIEAMSVDERKVWRRKMGGCKVKTREKAIVRYRAMIAAASKSVETI